MYLLLSFSLLALSGSGQHLQLKYSEFKDHKLLVHYSLHDSVIGRSFTIRLYISKDNFLNPLEKVSGDIGLEVKPGPDKTISWNAADELGATFDGKVSLEIRAKVFIPFINTESINQHKVYKRKRKYNLTWTGGTPQNILNFDLYHGEEKIMSFPNLANVGTYSLEFPSYVKPKKNYRFRISDSKNKEDVVYTTQFKIKRKVPLLVKVVPVVLAGSLIYTLLQPKDVEPDLPMPIPPNK